MDKPRNVMLSDVEINYAKLRSPVENPFSKAKQYEAQLVLSAEQAAELKGLGLNVKEKDGVLSFSAKRNAFKSSGEENGAVRVVDANKAPFDQNIGNGSRGNVILWVYPYSAPGRNGVSASLTAIQVVNHVPFESDSIDFDVLGESEDSAENLF